MSEIRFTVEQQGTGTHGSRPWEQREEKHYSHSRHWDRDGDEKEEEQSLRSTGTELGSSKCSLSRSSIQAKPGKEESRDKKTSIPSLAEAGSTGALSHCYTFAPSGINSQVFPGSSTTGFRNKTDLTLDGAFEI